MALPVGYLLKPRRRSMWEDHHRFMMDQQQDLFNQARKRRKENKDGWEGEQGKKEVGFCIEGPVFYKIHLREGKFDQMWTILYNSGADRTGVRWDLGLNDGRTQRSEIGWLRRNRAKEKEMVEEERNPCGNRCRLWRVRKQRNKPTASRVLNKARTQPMNQMKAKDRSNNVRVQIRKHPERRRSEEEDDIHFS